MADGFEQLLRSGSHLPKFLPVFDFVCRELTCWPGRPDFLGIEGRIPNASNGHTPLSPLACIALSLLKPQARRTEKYIQTRISSDERTTRAVLRALEKRGYVIASGQRTYRLGPASEFIRLEITAFELKLSNPRRAVYQAIRNKEFSDRSYVVVPPKNARGYAPFSPAIDRWGIGLLTYDLETGRIKTISKSRTLQPPDRAQAIRSRSRIASEAVSEETTGLLCGSTY